MPNPLAEFSKKASTAHLKNSFEDAKRLAAEKVNHSMVILVITDQVLLSSPYNPIPSQELSTVVSISPPRLQTRLFLKQARRMLEDAHKGKAGPAPIVVVPTTAPPVNRPPKPGTLRAKEIQKSKTSNLDQFKEELKRYACIDYY